MSFSNRNPFQRQALYRTLAEEILPCYYERAAGSGVPSRWVARMKKSIGRLGPRFSTQRMVRDYAVKTYVPTAGGRGAEVDEASYWAP